MPVIGRPSVAIRRHRFPKVFLEDLVGRGTVDLALSQYLSAAVRARKNIIVCGGVDAGKTTMRRALINEIEPKEPIINIEVNFALGLDLSLVLERKSVGVGTSGTVRERFGGCWIIEKTMTAYTSD